MPLPMNQNKAWEDLRKIIEDDKATLVSPIEGKLGSRTQITYHCECGEMYSKVFSNIKNGTGGALCNKCSQKRGNERRIITMENGEKPSVNNGKTVYNRHLAEETVKKDKSILLGIYLQNEDGSRTEITNDRRITRESYLHIRCPCGTEDFVNFRDGNERLCLCKGCRKGDKSNNVRNRQRGTVDTINIIESMTKRAERIEKEGQECTDCKKHKPVSEFFGRFNSIEKCKVYKGRCYPCSRKLRTSNRENTLRNSSIEDFMKAELVVAKDRNKKRGKNHEFDITVDFLMELYEKQTGLCAMSAIEMSTTSHRDECPEGMRVNPNKLSIDRIDSNLGYTEDNVQLVCCWVNLMKLDVSIDVFKERCRLISSFILE
jgi:hypothetical protein